MRSGCRRDRGPRQPLILLVSIFFRFLLYFYHFLVPVSLSSRASSGWIFLFPSIAFFLPFSSRFTRGREAWGIHPSRPRFVYLLNATNNICFYFCAGLSPALYFLKAVRLWRTAGWMIERKQNGLEGWKRGREGERERERESEAGYSGQIIVKGRTFCPPATLFLIKGVL